MPSPLNRLAQALEAEAEAKAAFDAAYGLDRTAEYRALELARMRRDHQFQQHAEALVKVAEAATRDDWCPVCNAQLGPDPSATHEPGCALASLTEKGEG